MCVLIAMNMGFIGSVKSSIEKWKKKNIDIYIHDLYFIYAIYDSYDMNHNRPSWIYIDPCKIYFDWLSCESVDII